MARRIAHSFGQVAPILCTRTSVRHGSRRASSAGSRCHADATTTDMAGEDARTTTLRAPATEARRERRDGPAPEPTPIRAARLGATVADRALAPLHAAGPARSGSAYARPCGPTGCVTPRAPRSWPSARSRWCSSGIAAAHRNPGPRGSPPRRARPSHRPELGGCAQHWREKAGSCPAARPTRAARLGLLMRANARRAARDYCGRGGVPPSSMKCSGYERVARLAVRDGRAICNSRRATPASSSVVALVAERPPGRPLSPRQSPPVATAGRQGLSGSRRRSWHRHYRGA